MYKILQKYNEVESNIKEKWEKDLKINITTEEWRKTLGENFRISQSKYWREFSWKVSMRFFSTPEKLKKCFPGLDNGCWRGCGEQEANYIHMLFTCPVLTTQWEGVKEILKYIFELKEPLQVQHWLGIYLKGKIRAKDIYFFNILRVTAVKQVTKAWKQPNTPKLRAWVLTTEQSLEMERLTPINREQIHIWNKLYCKERLIKTVEIFNQIKEMN